MDRPIHRLFLVLLFAVEVATQWTKVIGLDRYTTTTTTSIGLAIYLVVLIAWMIRRLSEPPPR